MPHSPQNFFPGGLALPQAGHSTASTDPQSAQKRLPSGFCAPQAEQSILLREDRDGICTLTMNRPQQMNLLTTEMLEALQAF